MATNRRLGSSFRDPSGFVFRHDGTLYRQVNHSFRDEYDAFIETGLYDRLVEKRMLVGHREVTEPRPDSNGAYKIIAPQPIPFVSYPYEWCFGQLRAAALLTLDIALLALEYNMVLRDASAYNVQFVGYRPIFIDTLSFGRYVDGQPWAAYRQFCSHFLAPLTLMLYGDQRIASMLRSHIDGIPLNLAVKLLPWKTRLRPGLLTHLHLHARSQERHAETRVIQRPAFSKRALQGLLENLRSTITSGRLPIRKSAWSDYYEESSYSRIAMEGKRSQVESMIDRVTPKMVWDLGANTGRFGRIAAEKGITTIAFDLDPTAVEIGYRETRQAKIETLLPLVSDLTNPSPAVGWAHGERMSLRERGPADCVMALALLHHLAIGANVPLESVASFLAELGETAIVEFVPKEDSQVQRLLASREDIFPDYSQAGFEREFGSYFTVLQKEPIPDSQRTVYLMRKRGATKSG